MRTIRVRPSRRPAFEPLEGRALLSAGLDSSFGQSGLVGGTFGNASAPGHANAVAVQLDGKVVVAGSRPTSPSVSDLVVERFNTDGSVDTTFGAGGSEVVYADAATMTAVPGSFHTILIQPDGKIVVGGGLDIARINPDGTPDASFGDNGVDVNSLTNVSISCMALAPDGKIVLGGVSGEDFFAERIDIDGAPDPTFGTAGVALIPSPYATSGPFSFPPSISVNAIAIQANDKVILAGATAAAYNLPIYPPPESAAIRLNGDGTLDTAFGQGGSVFGPYLTFTSAAVQVDGKIDLSGYYDYQKGYIDDDTEGVTQFDADGTKDPTYNGTIFAFSGIPFGESFPAYNLTDQIAIEPDGKVLAVGGNPGFSLARMTDSGNLDPSFAQGGILFVASDLTTTGAIPDALAVAPDGKILVVTSGTTSRTGDAFTLARIDPGQTVGDYLGDGKTNAAIELPSLGAVAIRPSNGLADQLIPFGIAGAGNTLPAPGDYDGSGHTELGVYLPKLGAFAYRPNGLAPDVLVPFGIAGAGQTIPAPGDYEGTGQSDIAAYLPSLGDFAIRPPSGPDRLIPFGIAGAGKSIPAPGDYEGTGQDDIAVYLPSIGAFAIRPSTGGPDKIIPFGIAGAGQSIPVPGDYDGSGKTEIAVYLPSLGEFAYRPANGGADVLTKFGIAGSGQSLPMPGDYDGSGHTELGVYLPSLGDFAYRPSHGPDVIEGFGIPGQSIPFTTNPPSDTLPASLTAAAVSAESVGWIDVAPMAIKQKKASEGQAATESPMLN